MKIDIKNKLDSKQDVLIVGRFEKGKIGMNVLDKELLSEKSFSGKWGDQYVTTLPSYKKVLVLGLGDEKKLTLEKVRRLMGKAVSFTKSSKNNGFTTDILQKLNFDAVLLGRAVTEGLILADYGFTKYLAKEKRDKKKPLQGVSVVFSSNKSFSKGLNQGKIIAESTNLVRDLVNEPANVINSISIERVAKKIVAGSKKLKLKVLNQPELKRLGMGALLGVNAGSRNPPKLIILEYNGAKSKGKPTAIVGKGITFDSGGYNIKPTGYIESMKTDMGGAGAVLGTMKAAAALNINKNLIGVLAVCENMVDGQAQRPGDIIKAYNGKTIEIGNTDAEGRLVLADALAYTEERYKPEIMIDLATLTGACVVALGYYAAALVGNDDKLIEKIKEAGSSSGDRVWPLPFFEDYHDWMDGSISDLNNMAQKGKGWEGGSITAGVFLSKFVSKAKWAHLDIAGSARLQVGNDYLNKGVSGSGVRVLSYYLLRE